MRIKLTKDRQMTLIKAGFKLGFQNMPLIARLLLPILLPFYLVLYATENPALAPLPLQLLHLLLLVVKLLLLPATSTISFYALNQVIQGKPAPSLTQSWNFFFERFLWVWKVILSGSISFLAALIPLIIPGIRRALQYTLIGIIAVVEPPSQEVKEVLEQSQTLISGQEKSVFRLLLIGGLLMFGLMVLVFLPIAWIETFWMEALIEVISEILSTPLSAILILLYQTLKYSPSETEAIVPENI